MPKGYNQNVESPAKVINNPDCLRRHLSMVLQGPLPGPAAQAKMAPTTHRPRPSPRDTPRQSAVLALCTPTQDGIAMLFTLRPTTLKHHGGQISFPGGGYEPQDRNYAETALRETQEELGIPIHNVEILGEMTSLFIAPSQNLVHTFVGWLPLLPPLNPDPAEVAEVLVVPLQVLLDPASRGTHIWKRNGQQLAAPCYRVPAIWGKVWEKTCIWGATAMILSEFLTLIKAGENQNPA